jgi:hypothetical protein
MFGLGLPELVVLVWLALPVLAVMAPPIAFAVMLWRRQTELRIRVERLEASVMSAARTTPPAFP